MLLELLYVKGTLDMLFEAVDFYISFLKPLDDSVLNLTNSVQVSEIFLKHISMGSQIHELVIVTNVFER